MRGHTHKPCHGCGQKPKDYSGRPTEGVCSDCADLLAWARKAHAHSEETKEKISYRLPWAPHGLPYLYRGSGRGRSDADGIYQRNFFNLFKLIGEPDLERYTSAEDPVIPDTKWTDSDGSIKLVPAVREALTKIYSATLQMLLNAYDEGYRDGSNLISRLATGEVSIDYYNEAVTGDSKE